MDDDAWYYTFDREGIWSPVGTREEVIARGLLEAAPGDCFWVAKGYACGLASELFDADHLLDIIDDTHDDVAYEDSFSVEANISSAQIAELTAEMNRTWSAWAAKHNPRSRRLILSEEEKITKPAIPTTPAGEDQ